MSHRARWWHSLDDGRLQCDLCPRECRLSDGQRGFCFVRAREGEQLVLTTDGRSSGFCLDPIEKKPLNHFYPGTSVLSFGTAGCNLGCAFCQNWSLSKAREHDVLQAPASAEAIAARAVQLGAKSVAFTYNDPVIFAEYAIDVAHACRGRGVKTVAVTAGFVNAAPRAELFSVIDAANVDLKAFTNDFYRKQTLSELAPVLETLEYLAKHTTVWLEITTLLIPTLNDSEAEVAALSEWVVERLGPDVPLHFSAFHPDFRLRQLPRTPAATLSRARRQAMQAGLRYVYTGNVHDLEGDATRCPGCGAAVIERDWYLVKGFTLSRGRCACGTPIAGHFDATAGSFGRRRVPVEV
jgi:pyruvate formate lyase activating enzyme